MVHGADRGRWKSSVSVIHYPVDYVIESVVITICLQRGSSGAESEDFALCALHIAAQSLSGLLD